MNPALTGIFGAGVLTFFTPCVLPLIPIYLSALAGTQAAGTLGAGRGRLLLNSLLFAVGFVAVFTTLGLGAAGVGATLNAHKAAIQFAGAVLILLFGLKFLGVIQVPLLDRVVTVGGSKTASRLGVLNALVMGIRLIGKQTEATLKQSISALRREPCPGVGAIPDGFLQSVDGLSGRNCGRK